jgi:preprotein translocase subunit SecD
MSTLLDYPEGVKPCLALLAMVCLAGAQGAPKPGVVLAVHILVTCGAGAGARVKIPDSPTPLCLDRAPFLTQDDVQSAEIQMSSKKHPRVFLTFRPAAAMRELQVTQKNIGNRVGIVLNGRVVSTVTIAAASRLLYIDGDFTRPEADALVMAFNGYLASHPQ